MRSSSFFLGALAACVFVDGGRALGQDAKGDYAVEYLEAFQGKPAQERDFVRTGPDAEQCVKFEPEGLRIRLPAGVGGERARTGLVSAFGLKGDFEITVAYEILQEVGPNTRLALAIALDKPFPWQNLAVLTRRMYDDPDFYFWMSRRDPMDIKPQVRMRSFPARSQSGQLRLVRSGAEISFLAADGRDKGFTLLKKEPFGSEEIREVALVGWTGGAKAALDVRFTALRLRAAALTRPGPPKQITFVPPQKEYAQSYSVPLKAGPGIVSGWDIEGPDADQLVQFEAKGLHIALPRGWQGERPGTGLRSRFGVKGDFEITLSFDLLHEPRQEDAGTKNSTRLNLVITKETPKLNFTSVSRIMSRHFGQRFVTWSSLWNEAEGEQKTESHNIPAGTKIGRLRLVRSGPEVYYGAGEGDGEITYFRKSLFGVEDIRHIRILATTGGDTAAYDVRVTDVRIRADEIPNMPEAAAAGKVEQGDAAPSSPRKGWMAAGLLLGMGLLVFVGIGLGLWFYVQRRNLPPPASEAKRAKAPSATKP